MAIYLSCVYAAGLGSGQFEVSKEYSGSNDPVFIFPPNFIHALKTRFPQDF
jgi:hypothetical protein